MSETREEWIERNKGKLASEIPFDDLYEVRFSMVDGVYTPVIVAKYIPESLTRVVETRKGEEGE